MESIGTSEGSIENVTKWDNNFAPIFVGHHLLPDMNINGHCLVKSTISFPKKVITLYRIAYLDFTYLFINYYCIIDSC